MPAGAVEGTSGTAASQPPASLHDACRHPISVLTAQKRADLHGLQVGQAVSMYEIYVGAHDAHSCKPGKQSVGHQPKVSSFQASHAYHRVYNTGVHGKDKGIHVHV